MKIIYFPILVLLILTQCKTKETKPPVGVHEKSVFHSEDFIGIQLNDSREKEIKKKYDFITVDSFIVNAIHDEVKTIIVEKIFGWDDPGDFHRIRVKNDSTEYSYFNLDGWVSVNSYALQYIPSFKRTNLVNSNYLIVQKSSDNDVLLFAFGYAYASGPGLLSIINLTRFRKPSLIFNDEFFLYDYQDLNNDGSLDIEVTKNISSNEELENVIESKTFLLKGGAFQHQSSE